MLLARFVVFLFCSAFVDPACGRAESRAQRRAPTSPLPSVDWAKKNSWYFLHNKVTQKWNPVEALKKLRNPLGLDPPKTL